jgi:hypothetical protein
MTIDMKLKYIYLGYKVTWTFLHNSSLYNDIDQNEFQSMLS